MQDKINPHPPNQTKPNQTDKEKHIHCTAIYGKTSPFHLIRHFLPFAFFYLLSSSSFFPLISITNERSIHLSLFFANQVTRQNNHVKFLWPLSFTWIFPDKFCIQRFNSFMIKGFYLQCKSLQYTEYRKWIEWGRKETNAGDWLRKEWMNEWRILSVKGIHPW